MTTGLRGSSVILTGAGSGIGRAAALAFAGEGARVVVADLNEEGVKNTVADITSRGGSAVAVVGDLSDQRVVEDTVASAVETFGGIDVLVNNAGIPDAMSAVADVSDAVWERVLRINLTAPFQLTRAVLPHMLAKGANASARVIVNTASEAGLRGSAAGAAYTSTKHGVVGLTKSLAVMYRDQGIRTNAIAPGGTFTGMRPDVDGTELGPAALGQYMGAMGRLSDPEEQAAAIVFLASAAASNINGVILPVDNGWSAT